MQQAYEFLVKMLAGIANFLYAQIVGAKDVIVGKLNEVTANLVERFDSLTKTLSDVAKSVAENAEAQDERLSQIQQANKDSLAELVVVSNKQNEQRDIVAETLTTLNDVQGVQDDLMKRQDTVWGQTAERFDGVQNIVTAIQEKVNEVAAATTSVIDNAAIEDAFYKTLHQDIKDVLLPSVPAAE